MFLDEAVVEFVSGRGGSGAVSFHREKHVPRGGPNGADGGRGGDVILLADRNRRTLYDLRLQQRFEAKDGGHGLGNKRGKDSKNIIVKVPVGTVIINEETGQPIVDMSTHGMKFAICKGGKGGFGNQHYTSSVRQAPNFAQKGAPGERILARMELKLLADVGLIGLPNAGKSTLIARISAARPKIADYPFTTIIPNLGVARYAGDTFVVADMPGLIAGASEGVGLGHQFLKHVERTRVLVHVVEVYPVDESDPLTNYNIIESELKLYSEEIWARPRLIALSKTDTAPHEKYNEIRKSFETLGLPLFPISAVTGEGIDALLHALYEVLQEAKGEPEIPVLMPALEALDNIPFEVERTEEGFVISGRRIQRLVAMTDLENEEAVRYLHRRLDRLGVIKKLREMGAEEGDDVVIGEAVFAFTDEN
ncbi:GTPase ObgE [Fimbriimonas ginsengisoli]|uniref:GTPase Obg n=1 Tax=Fimbriimonas ginsengisoli Gsoil 348 TaxID=661478 RepID=A0A068NUK6_FIMGI|nr:GTPase ObgE [Fimbriimonas ginsengisoli]AIE87106.1 GTP-binding protein Obg/CgtA [Fimbriimonas ginsengisoli Gsoil 348]